MTENHKPSSKACTPGVRLLNLDNFNNPVWCGMRVLCERDNKSRWFHIRSLWVYLQAEHQSIEDRTRVNPSSIQRHEYREFCIPLKPTRDLSLDRDRRELFQVKSLSSSTEFGKEGRDPNDTAEPISRLHHIPNRKRRNTAEDVVRSEQNLRNLWRSNKYTMQLRGGGSPTRSTWTAQTRTRINTPTHMRNIHMERTRTRTHTQHTRPAQAHVHIHGKNGHRHTLEDARKSHTTDTHMVTTDTHTDTHTRGHTDTHTDGHRCAHDT
jgi:hypothetical protein